MIAPVSSSIWPMRPSLILASDFASERFVLEERLGQRRLDEGRAERVDADVVRRKLDGHRLGEAFHRVLAGAVDRALRAPT